MKCKHNFNLDNCMLCYKEILNAEFEGLIKRADQIKAVVEKYNEIGEMWPLRYLKEMDEIKDSMEELNQKHDDKIDLEFGLLEMQMHQYDL